jgi:hypothetical protein
VLGRGLDKKRFGVAILAEEAPPLAGQIDGLSHLVDEREKGWWGEEVVSVGTACSGDSLHE